MTRSKKVKEVNPEEELLKFIEEYNLISKEIKNFDIKKGITKDYKDLIQKRNELFNKINELKIKLGYKK